MYANAESSMRMRLEQIKGALKGDVWDVGEATEGGDAWFGEGVAAKVRLMADNGNFLVAVIPCTGSGAGDEPWSEFVSGVAARGNVLRQDALNCGLHRLVVLMILPENEAVRGKLSAALASSSRAEFRTLILPSIDLNNTVFVAELRKSLATIGPLSIDKFLVELDESTFAAHVDVNMLSDGRSRLANDYAKGLVTDIQSLLGGEKREGEDWSAVGAVITRHMEEAGVSTLEESE